jgi:hypothetical protein
MNVRAPLPDFIVPECAGLGQAGGGAETDSGKFPTGKLIQRD